jgi:hypothetical protein
MAGPYPTARERFPRLRQSLLSDFDNCALTSHFGLMFEGGWTSHPAGRGQLVHRTLARCLELMEEYGEAKATVDVALEVFEEVLAQRDYPLDPDDPMGDHVVNLPLREIAEARITVKTWAHYQSYTVEDFAGIEKRLSIVLDAYPDTEGGEWIKRELSGKLDLLLIRDDHATVVDWKDTWGIPSERLKIKGGVIVGGYDEDEAAPSGPNISEEGYFQQRFYALLIFLTYPRIQRVTLREFYPRYASGAVLDRDNRPINPVREATVDRIALPEIEAEMRALVERFDRSREAYAKRRRRRQKEERARRVFTPSPGSHCYYCANPDECPIFPRARQEGRISSPEEAELYAGRLQVVRAVGRQIGKALRAFSNAHGNVAVKDAKRPRVYGPIVRVREEKPSAAQVTEAVRKGIPVESLYRRHEYVEFAVHTPEEEHPFARQAREEEEMLLAAEKEEGGG